MAQRLFVAIAVIATSILPPVASAQSDEYEITPFSPAYVPPSELIYLLGAVEEGGRYRVHWIQGGETRGVDIHPHESANLLVLAGAPRDVAVVRSLAQAVDVPPRQIEVVATIIEVDRAMAYDLGIDWDGLWGGSGTRASFNYRETDQITGTEGESRRTTNENKNFDISSMARLSDFVNLLEETGAGKSRTTPRILTLNNRPATILDGQRVTYVTRASSFSNIYETQTMDAGLKLDVLPTLGESGYLTLSIRAELTGLSNRDISGSPIKDGQIIDNTVIVRDGDTVLLGGFSRTVERTGKKRFPILGHVLPFLFSRETRTEQTLNSFIALRARVVDLDPVIDGEIEELFQN